MCGLFPIVFIYGCDCDCCVYKTIKLERKGCNVLVTTRDKGYVIR